MKEISLDIVGQSHSDLNKSVPKIANLITNSPGIHEVILNFKQPRNELQLDLTIVIRYFKIRKLVPS